SDGRDRAGGREDGHLGGGEGHEAGGEEVRKGRDQACRGGRGCRGCRGCRGHQGRGGQGDRGRGHQGRGFRRGLRRSGRRGLRRVQGQGRRILIRPELADEPATEHEGGGLIRRRWDIAYDGTNFSGWAKQPGRRTVQGVLEETAQQVLRMSEPVRLTVAGRTDAGVHATGQVAHTDLPPVDVSRLRYRLYRALPD